MNKVKTKRTTVNKNKSNATWYSTIDKQYGLLYMLVNQIAVKYDNTAVEQNRNYPKYILEKVQKDLKDMGVETFLNKIPSIGSIDMYLNGQRKESFAGSYQNNPSAKKHRTTILNVVKRK
jgi:hypothetical protein